MARRIANAGERDHTDLVDSIRPADRGSEADRRQFARDRPRPDGGLYGQRVTVDFSANESRFAPFPTDLAWNDPPPDPGFAIPGRKKFAWPTGRAATTPPGW